MLLSRLISKIEYSGSFCDGDIELVTSNSSRAVKNSLFVCIKGFSVDGHDFALGAYKQGCRYFVAQREIELPSDANIIYTDNTRLALALISAEFYRNPSRELTVIGITGTKGKTTTALMIKHILDQNGIPCGYIGSNGIMYGNCKFESVNTTPESHIIQEYMRNMADAGIRSLAIEVSSQALDLYRVSGIEFDICLFTNFSPDHIGGNEHPNLEAYFEAKKKLFDNFSPRAVVANADDGMTERILADSKAEKVFYSIEKSSDFRAEKINIIKGKEGIGVSFECCTENEKIPCRLSFPGEFNVYNALAAVSVTSLLGVKAKDSLSSLSSAVIGGRFEVYTMPGGATFVIDYAHNGKSLESVLKTLRGYTDGKLICLFGSVGGRTQIRRVEMGKVASRYADFSVITADNPDFESVDSIMSDIAKQFKDKSSYVKIPDRKEAIEYAYEIAGEGDIVLLAGKGHERYQTVMGKKEYFCEAEILEGCKLKELANK